MKPEILKPAEARVLRSMANSDSMPPPIWAALSDQGRQRENNEDAWGAFALDHQLTPLQSNPLLWPSHGVLYLLSDGMGGARAGEKASRFCVDHLSAELQARAGNPDLGAALREAFLATHATLIALSRANPDWQGMGATLSALWLQPGGAALIGHVGDSRIYGFHLGKWRQWTDDHSMGAGLVRRGQLTPEEATRFRFRSLLEQVMGGDGRPIEPQIVRLEWQPADAFALCSDGLFRPLAGDLETRLTSAVQPSPSPAGVQALVDAANSVGGPDNITVLLARLQS